MLKAVYQVSHGLMRDIGNSRRYSLENIVNAVEAYSIVDRVIYVEYEASVENYIWGQFFKFSRIPSAYSSFETIVEVRYANHLTTNWRRFVVAKELCHSLDVNEGSHSVTDRSIDRLLSRFALLSAMKAVRTSFPAFDAETMAEIGALELLCPISVRKSLLGSDTAINLCERFGIPHEYASLAFEDQYIKIIDELDV